ncbi:magnesium and cobalt transport protein CorA [Leucobacter sp. HY1908]
MVDIAVYRDGARLTGAGSMREAALQAEREGGFVWVRLDQPSATEVTELAEVFHLHPLAVEDVTEGNQRPKIERYDDVSFVVMRPASYDHDTDLVEFGELHALVGPRFIVSVQFADKLFMPEVSAALEASPERLARGPMAVLHAIVDRVVDDYAPVASSIEGVIASIEDDLFNGAGSDGEVARRIYLLSREVIGFQRATGPLREVLHDEQHFAEANNLDIEVQRAIRDVADHLIPICDRADNYRQLLQSALSVHLSLAAQAREEQMERMTETSIVQSDQMKKISSWAAIIFAPTLISGIYGMNFQHMSELDWKGGYPLSIAAMLLFAGGLYVIFKRKDWL